jgi:hypothetical protein
LSVKPLRKKKIQLIPSAIPLVLNLINKVSQWRIAKPALGLCFFRPLRRYLLDERG